jgi:hypothetical protein
LAKSFKFVVSTSSTSAHMAVIQNRRINLFFGLRRRCRGRSVAARHIINVLFTALKSTDTASNWVHVCCVLTAHASQVPMNLYLTAAFRSNKFTHHSLPSTRVHNTCHFALLLFWMHVTDWGTDDPGGATSVASWWVRHKSLHTRRHV